MKCILYSICFIVQIYIKNSFSCFIEKHVNNFLLRYKVGIWEKSEEQYSKFGTINSLKRIVLNLAVKFFIFLDNKNDL